MKFQNTRNTSEGGPHLEKDGLGRVRMLETVANLLLILAKPRRRRAQTSTNCSYRQVVERRLAALLREGPLPASSHQVDRNADLADLRKSNAFEPQMIGCKGGASAFHKSPPPHYYCLARW